MLHGLFESNDVEIMDENFPCFVVLMDDHTEESYSEMLRILKDYATDKIDDSYVCLTPKDVRIMGDWSLAEHNASVNSQNVEVKTDDALGWHFINAVNENMKNRNIIHLHYQFEHFHRFLRYFETLRGIHYDCAEIAFNLILSKSW